MDWLSRNVVAEKILLYVTVAVAVTVVLAAADVGMVGFLVIFIVVFSLAELWRREMRRRRAQNAND